MFIFYCKWSAGFQGVFNLFSVHIEVLSDVNNSHEEKKKLLKISIIVFQREKKVKLSRCEKY